MRTVGSGDGKTYRRERRREGPRKREGGGTGRGFIQVVHSPPEHFPFPLRGEVTERGPLRARIPGRIPCLTRTSERNLPSVRRSSILSRPCVMTTETWGGRTAASTHFWMPCTRGRRARQQLLESRWFQRSHHGRSLLGSFMQASFTNRLCDNRANKAASPNRRRRFAFAASGKLDYLFCARTPLSAAVGEPGRWSDK